jgi:hypothetical protein
MNSRHIKLYRTGKLTPYFSRQGQNLALIPMLGSLGPLSTLKASSRGEAFSHTYKLTTSSFHNQCGITPTISSSHIRPWIEATTTYFSYRLLGRDLLVNLSSNTNVGITRELENKLNILFLCILNCIQRGILIVE